MDDATQIILTYPACRDINNLNKTLSPSSLLLEMRKKDAISAILGVWGMDTLPHTNDMLTPPR